MAIDLDVVVNADARQFPFGVLVVNLGQGTQRRRVHLGEGAGAAAGQFFEWSLVLVGEQCASRPVQFVEAEEAQVAQARQYPARGHQHAILDLVQVASM